MAERGFPLLPEQQRFWLLRQLELEGQQDIINLACWLPQELDHRELQQRFVQLGEHYDTLRTTIHQNGEGVFQKIMPSLAGHDLRVKAVNNGQPLKEFIAETNRTISQSRQLFRADLLQMPDAQNYLLLTSSRMLCDITSLEHIAAYMLNPTAVPHLPPTSFAAYVETKVAAQHNLDKWIAALDDATLVCELPLDKIRPTVQRDKVENQLEQISDVTITKVTQLAEQHKVPPAVVYLAAFFTLLYRYTLQNDILVGLARRDDGSGVPPIGPLTNLAVVRQQFPENITFADLLQALAASYTDIIVTPPPPFSELLTAIKPLRDLSRAPMVQHGFAFQDALPQLKRVYSSPVLHQMDVMLHIRAEQGATTAEWQYDSAIFSAETMRRMHSHLQTLIANAVETATSPLRHLVLISPEESHLIGVEWNETTQPVPDNDFVYRLFEKQAVRTPTAIAARQPDAAITYDDLNRRANRLAHCLKGQGISTNQVVPILAERNINYQIAMLGINKASAAFLPLSPAYPARRLASIFEKSEARLILVDSAYLELAKEAVGYMTQAQPPQILMLATILEQDHPEDNLPPLCGMDDLAYMMFTSGSTGEPKGVMVHHAGMINHNYAKIIDLEMGASDVLAQTSRQSFDIVVWQFLAPLINGGSIYIMPDGIALDPVELLKTADENGITVMQLVPVNIEALLDVADAMGRQAPKLEKLRWMVPTGDALHTDLCRRWLNLYPHTRMLNTYGATECSDDQCHHVIPLPPSAEYRPAVMTVGRPIINTKVYILDENMQLVPVGVIGEVYIAGVGVGPGYLKDPERTAKTFVSNPFSDDPKARLYRSGDQARYLPDGTIEFIGRIGFMVKIRGMRLEPGEIQAVLGRHPQVAQATLIVHDFEGIGTHLIAYIVCRKGEAASEDDLRAYLRQYLPDYMIPSYFVFLETLPLNANGKIDRKALPIPDLSQFQTTIVAPRNELESSLLEIWRKVINRDELSIHDNFFDVGGNSLLAMRLFSQIERQFRQRLPLATIFRAGTIAELAALLGDEDAPDAIAATLPGTTSLVHIQKGNPDRPPFFCIHAHGGHVLYFAALARNVGEDQPFYGVQALGIDGNYPPKNNFEELAALYIQEIRSVQPEGPYYLGGECMGGTIAFEITRQLEAMGQQVNLLVMFDTFCAGIINLKPGVPRWLYEVMYNAKRAKVMYFSELLTVSWEEKKRIVLDIVQRTALTARRIFFSRTDKVETDDPLTTTFVALGEAEHAYKPQFVNATITLFNSELPWGVVEDQTLGWDKHTKQVEIHQFPLLWDMMILGPGVALPSKRLRELLDEKFAQEQQPEAERVAVI